MPKASPKKIKSARRFSLKGGFRILFVLLLIASAVVLLMPSASGTKKLSLERGKYRLEIAADNDSQEQGLGDRNGLEEHSGMLFVFSNQTDRCFWMKDMKFAIDIIWVDSAKRITKIQPHLSPDTYPEQYCGAAQYVIELASGEADRNHLAVKQQLDF